MLNLVPMDGVLMGTLIIQIAIVVALKVVRYSCNLIEDSCKV